MRRTYRLRYDDGALESVRAATPSQAVNRRNRRDMLPQSIVCPALVRGMLDWARHTNPLLERMGREGWWSE